MASEKKYGGSETELYSEVLAQVCLAFSMVKNKMMTSSDLNENTIKSLTSYISTHSRAPLNNKNFINELIKFGIYPISKGFTWVDAQGRNMFEIKKIYKLGSGYVVYNDKIYGNGDDSPYKAFKNSISGVRDDKWNPADIWVMNKVGKSSISSMNKKNWGLPAVNNFFIEQYKKRNIIPLSLKKPQKGFHYEVVNTNEFYGRLVFGRTKNPDIEFTDGNKDVKINFTIETVELPKGMTNERAARSGVPGGKVVDSKNIRLKFTSDGNQLELEYNQTAGAKYAEARMGKLGTANIKQIVNNTTRMGVGKLKKIQENYMDKKITNKTNGQEDFLPSSGWYKLDQLGGGKPRRNPRVDDDNQELHNLFADYLLDLWKEIGGVAPMDLKDRFGKGGKLSTSKDFWTKSRAGELGVAIGSVSRDLIKRRLVQNLYDVAASIAYGQGLTKTEQIIARNAGDITGFSRSTSRNMQFRAGPYVKVY